jgi:hypothetical protein
VNTYIEDLYGNSYTRQEFWLNTRPPAAEEDADDDLCKYCNRLVDECRSEMCEEAAEDWRAEYGEVTE